MFLCPSISTTIDSYFKGRIISCYDVDLVYVLCFGLLEFMDHPIVLPAVTALQLSNMEENAQLLANGQFPYHSLTPNFRELYRCYWRNGGYLCCTIYFDFLYAV